MKQKLTHFILSVGFVFSLSSCEVLIDSFLEDGFYTPQAPVQTGTNAAQTSFTNGIAWQPSKYDGNGIPIYGYADGRPVYGYTKQGSLIYQVNHLYSGCYVPGWGSSDYHPHGVIRTYKSPL